MAGAPGPGRGGGVGRGGALVPDGALGPARESPVVVDGRAVGVASLRFPAAQPAAERQVRSALGRTVLWGSLLAVAVAALIGLGATAWIRRPLRRLTATAGAMAGGDRSARTGLAPQPGELGELARAFDRMAERIQREDELRRTLVADVAHELRTPLAIAQGELEALLDGVEEPTPDRLGSLHEELLRLGRLVEDLGTLSAAEAAGLRLEQARVDLAEVVRRAVEATGSLARAAGVTVELTADAASVAGDPVRLEQVARNLLANAIKFTPEGGRVEVRVARAGDACELEVADTGPGIPEDELARVFDRFWRGRHAAGVAGTGIGLAVVHELVAAHGGRVGAASRPGGGAAFTVTLPAA
ncbi:MAG: HAMP domain-containing sensor histidine kinase [Thermoleophilia bacterium]